MANKSFLTTYVRRMTSTLLNAGVKSVVISPGSRSTPLAYAFASTESLKVYMQIDERSAGFFALGLAKASSEPVVLLCTSGTAASNYFPAITEAHYARIPLIVMTADRPHELREVGAPQAIDQVRMYGQHVKSSIDLPIPEENIEDFMERHVRRSLSVALTAPRGPVHINIPFREPLLIDLDLETPKSTFSKRITTTDSLDESTLEEVAELLRTSKKGIIIVGELPVNLNNNVFWKFAKALNWPVLCDPLSNLRANIPENCKMLCIDRYDALLKSESFGSKVIPDTVIRFGPQPVSKSLSLYLKKSSPETMIVVDESPEFRDSIHIVTHHIQSEAEAVLSIIVHKQETSYNATWRKANDIASSVTESINSEDEGAFTQLLLNHLQSGSDLICGSSMPIRDIDTFFGKTEKDIHLFANRGANGIDGVVSTAFGIQTNRKRPAWLLIGDLSFLHDVNGLIVTRFHKTDLTIIIMNNDGGGIFSYLPQATSAEHFEELFGTPTGLKFGHIADMYDAQYAAVQTKEEFLKELLLPKIKNVRIIEVETDRSKNVKAHRQLWQQITERLDQNEWKN